MKVLIVEPGQYPRKAEIEKSLAAEQAIVGGLIECVYPWEDSACTHHENLLRKVAGLCNNANQVAHRANSTGVAGQESVDKMIQISQEIWKEVKNQW